MNIDWQKIEKKHPRGCRKFIIEYYGDDFNEAWLKQNICYCDLENFFDDNGIIIDKYHTGYKYIFGIKNRNIKGYAGYIKNQYISKEFENYEERNKKAILKAFEILEQQLKD
jgi:hypothetical protein